MHAKHMVFLSVCSIFISPFFFPVSLLSEVFFFHFPLTFLFSSLKISLIACTIFDVFNHVLSTFEMQCFGFALIKVVFNLRDM